MIYIGTVTGREIKNNRDGDAPVLLIQAVLTDETDVQTVEYIPAPGEDVNPPDGTSVIVFEISQSYKVAMAGDDGIIPSMKPGEKKIYSISGESISAFINLLDTGVIELNGNTRNAARQDDSTVSTSTEDSGFWAYLAALDGFVRGLGFLGPALPSSITGKINSGTDKVKMP